MTVSQPDIDHVLDFILPRIKAYQGNPHQSDEGDPASAFRKPFILGLTGLQGSGKSTWTTALYRALNDVYGLNTINLSIDDLYRDHAGLNRLQQNNPDNKLLRTRGQPGTHDEELASRFFESLRTVNSEGISIPAFDKARYHGEGDRVPEEEWDRVPPGKLIDVVIFEGWCLGFRPLPISVIKAQWEKDRFAAQNELGDLPIEPFPTRTLRDHSLEHLLALNENVSRYCNTFTGLQHLDYLLHLDTNDLDNVYRWRIQQEHALRQKRGTGMSDDEVSRFVQGYMPAYELYLDQLRLGFFEPSSSGNLDPGREFWKQQLQVLLDRNRVVVKVKKVESRTSSCLFTSG